MNEDLITAGGLLLNSFWVLIAFFSDNFWIILTCIFIARMLVPLASSIRGTYMNFEGNTMPLGKAEKKYYDNFRSHSITLASFTMTIIAIIIAFPRPELVSQNVKALLYLSIAMVSFFISSYFFLLRENRWFPFAGESLEYMGIVAIGFGLLDLVQNITLGNQLIGTVYTIFVIAMIGIAAKQIHIIIRFFYS